MLRGVQVLSADDRRQDIQILLHNPLLKEPDELGAKGQGAQQPNKNRGPVRYHKRAFKLLESNQPL